MINQNSSMVRWIAIAIIVVAVVAGGIIIYLDRNSTGGQVIGQSAVDIAKVNMQGAAWRGDKNAPIAIAYWSDYQCPFCKRNETDVMTRIIKDYVDTGKITLVYKDFVFLGDDSVTAGLAAKAVWEVAPDKFPAWHDAMYQKQDGENTGWGSKADVLALTGSLGIDSAKVDGLMTSKAADYQKALDADKAEAGTFGITGTPSFIIGKQLIVGAQPYETIKAAIETALSGK